MIRDMDLIRQMLLDMENCDPDKFLTINGYVQAGHVQLLIDAGLVEGNVACDSNGMPFTAVILRLTWDGYEFLDNARSDTVWNKAKHMIGDQLESGSFKILFKVLESIVLSQLNLS